MGVNTLQAALAAVTLVAIAAVILAILILVDKVQTGFWFRTLKDNDLLEPAANLSVLLLNSQNQFFFVSQDSHKPGFGAQITSCFYSVDGGSLSTAEGRFFARSRSGAFQLVDEKPPDAVVRLHFSAGNNRGYIVWFDMKTNQTYWLLEKLEWISSMPPVRPFVFLSSEPMA